MKKFIAVLALILVFINLDSAQARKYSVTSLSYIASLEKLEKGKGLRDSGTQIKFKVNYENEKYSRPVYDSKTEKRSKERIIYIPRKSRESMQRIFAIPKDAESKENLFKLIGFQESYEEIEDHELGLLIYSFNPKEVTILDNQIFIVGMPRRKGSSIISFDRNNLDSSKRYDVRLITLDELEVDFEDLNIS